MNILPKLPEHLFDKVMLYNSHPVADLVKESMVFHYYRLKNEHMGIHGSPFDRGGQIRITAVCLTLIDGRTEAGSTVEQSTT